jgi:hypothetical protein
MLVGLWQNPHGGHMDDTLQFWSDGKGSLRRLTPSEEEHCTFSWHLAPSGNQISFVRTTGRVSACFLFDAELSIKIVPAGDAEPRDTLVLSSWMDANTIGDGSKTIEFAAQWCHHYFHREAG